MIYPLTISKGETMMLTITARDSTGKLADLTSAKIYLTVRTKVGVTAVTLSKKSTAAGGSSAQVEILSQSIYRGQFRVYFAPSDTLTLTAATYVYDCWIELASGDRYSAIDVSNFVVQSTVTTTFV